MKTHTCVCDTKDTIRSWRGIGARDDVLNFIFTMPLVDDSIAPDHGLIIVVNIEIVRGM